MTVGAIKELKRIVVGIVVALFLGWLIENVVAVLLAAGGAYLMFNLVQVLRLERWLQRRRQQRPPEAFGIWGDIFHELYWLQERTRQRKRRLADIIDRFKQAAEAIPDAAVILRSDGRIEWLNDAAETYLGLRSPTDVNRPVLDLLRDVEFARFLATGDFEQAIDLPSPVDDSKVLSVRIAPYGDRRKLLLARDVSHIHNVERMRRDFVANVSHELRSPLTVIRGYTESLADEPDEFALRWRKPIHQLERQTNRMCRIVEDLLALSRIESNPQSASSIPVSVTDLLDTIVNDVREIADDELRLRVQSDSAVLLGGDYNELYSALSNLVFNAIQYTPVSKEIALRWWADADGAHLEVTDEGVGIEAEHIPRLTERFYRVDKARSRALGGTGLGLAIVKHVLARHEATLRIESVVGEGSSFICDFPSSRVIRAGGSPRPMPIA